MRRFLLRLALSASLLLLAVRVSPAAEKTAADLLPPTTIAYVEVSEPAKLLEQVKEHPLRKRLEAMPEFRQLTEENPDYLKARAGVGIAEFALGKKWHEALVIAAGQSLCLAFDAQSQGVAVIAHGSDKVALAEMRDRLVKMASDDAARKGNPAPLEEHTYRDHKFYKSDKGIAGVFGEWLIATNKAELGRSVVDRLLDGGDGLATTERFITAKKSVAGSPIAWAYVDVQTLRDAGAAKDLFKEKSDNPAAELLLGGILSTLQHAPLTSAALYLDDANLRLSINLPHDVSAVPEARQFYFGEKSQGAAPALLNVKNRLLAGSSYREIDQMWLRRSDLFDENVNAKLAEADSNLTTVFAGLDFGREVLGALKPQTQIVVAEQSFAGEGHEPKIKIPAFALVTQLKQPEKMQRQLKVSFQSFIGLANLGAGQQKLPQLELADEKIDGGYIVSGTYDYLSDDIEVSNDIIYNFSPSIAFVGDYYIIASTRELAKEIVALVRDGKDAAAKLEGQPDAVVNSLLTVDAGVVRALLEKNREPLIAQNMLEKGHGRDAAEKEIGGLLSLLKLLKDATLSVATDKGTLQFNAAIGLE